MKVVMFAILICIAIAKEQNYPQEALQCYASSALQSQKDDGKIICPLGSQVCIKEVVNSSSRADCGAIEGTYHGRDVWDRKLAQCVYRKCAAKCPTIEEDRARVFGGDGDNGEIHPFNRTSYCCDSNLCNRADQRLSSGLILIGFTLALLLY